MDDDAIRCRGLVKRYDDVLAVDRLDLDVLTTHHATLEDVFVELTGRHLREGG